MLVKKAITTLLFSCYAWLCSVPLSGAAENELTLVFAGDLSVIGSETHGDYAELAGLLDAQRRRDPNTLFLFGGASLSPSYLSSFDRGAHIIDILNSLMPSAMAVSERDLSFSVDEFSLRTYEAAFPMVLSNAFDPVTQGNLDGVNSRLIVSSEGMKVGVLAIMHPSATEQYLLKRLKITPPYESVVEEATALRQAGADVVVLMYSSDYFPFLNELLRSGVLDLAFTSDQDAMTRVYGDSRSANNIITHTGSAAVVHLQWSADSGSIAKISRELIDLRDIAPNHTVKQQVDEYKFRLDRILTEQLATLKGEYHTLREPLRTQENAFANLIADGLKSVAKTDIAIINSGAIRGNRRYPDGYQLTRRDIVFEVPFRSRINVLKLRGSYILDALENSVSEIEQGSGRFLQVSGMSYTFDSRLPAGARIKAVTVGGKALDVERLYSIASSDYLSAGGDGYKMFEFARGTTFSQQVTPLLTDIIISYFRKQQVVEGRVEGRIIDLAKTGQDNRQ